MTSSEMSLENILIQIAVWFSIMIARSCLIKDGNIC